VEVKELAECFNVPVRTICRDVDDPVPPFKELAEVYLY